MKTGDLHTGIGQLTHAFSQLNERWLEIKPHWNDVAGNQFEERHLQPIPSQLKLLMTAVQNLRAVAEEAIADLDDRPSEF